MITDFTIEGYIAHDFDELYELLSNAEPEFQRKEMLYEIRQCGNDKNWNECLITGIDLRKPRRTITLADSFNPECYDDFHFYNNVFELVHKHKLKEGKTIAQIICDNNGWDYSILPVYPKNFTPLFGDANKKDADGK